MTQSKSVSSYYTVSIATEVWTGIEKISQKFNLSASELLEYISDGKLAVIDPEELEDYLDLQEAIKAEADSENKETIPWEKIKKELGL
ncbi:MAG: BTB/POZ domain-containing protein [Moorea sp. SIO2B7]|nr:BTB/POZ domain-containing protein [Moorena sp. SIO2B7]